MKSSSIAGAGLGVFALKPVPRNTIVGYFNGVHRHRKDVFSSGEESVYLVEGGHPNEMLDIPPEFTHWQNYQASTGDPHVLMVFMKSPIRISSRRLDQTQHFTPGHLINHDDEGNVDYKDCWHPRSSRFIKEI